jgi:hypothetical protein
MAEMSPEQQLAQLQLLLSAVHRTRSVVRSPPEDEDEDEVTVETRRGRAVRVRCTAESSSALE